MPLLYFTSSHCSGPLMIRLNVLWASSQIVLKQWEFCHGLLEGWPPLEWLTLSWERQECLYQCWERGSRQERHLPFARWGSVRIKPLCQSYLAPLKSHEFVSPRELPSKTCQVVGTYFGSVDAPITVRDVATRGWCCVKCFHLPLTGWKCHPGHVDHNDFREAMRGEIKKHTLASSDPSHPSWEFTTMLIIHARWLNALLLGRVLA